MRLSQGNYNENSGDSEELILLVADLFHVVQLAVKITAGRAAAGDAGEARHNLCH